ncbi:TetR/AcrR family transcriptional regulator [Staphylococcus caeli]|uniref:TetR/AcrR family transcriptional regulator n=1 Tax=Staphylococcus caeli TaxID=2201815 RepID=UPI003F562EFB
MISLKEEMMTDARILKTKRSTRKALLSLLKVKKYDAISVKDICETANISRGTFYLHYKDKFDLAQQYQHEITKEGSKRVKNLLSHERHLLYYHMIHFWSNEAELLLLLISNNGSPDIQNQLKRTLQYNAEKNVFPYIKKSNFTEKEKHYFVVFISNAIFGIIQEWVNNGQQETPEELSDIINTIIPDSLLG